MGPAKPERNEKKALLVADGEWKGDFSFVKGDRSPVVLAARGRVRAWTLAGNDIHPGATRWRNNSKETWGRKKNSIRGGPASRAGEAILSV